MSRKAIGRASAPDRGNTGTSSSRTHCDSRGGAHPVLPTSLAWGNDDAPPSHGGIVGYWMACTTVPRHVLGQVKQAPLEAPQDHRNANQPSQLEGLLGESPLL